MKTFDELLALITQRGVHPVFGGPGADDFGIEQNAAELAEFLVAMQQLGVTSVLEIGTGYKAGLARFLHDDMGWKVVSVDIHNYGHSFSDITFVAGLPANERWEGSLQADLLIIDGDHSYAAVKADHEWYATWAAKVIAFHDIAGLRDCEGVRDYWDNIAYQPGSWERGMPELKPGYRIICASNDQRGGIGYIVLAEVEAPKLSAAKIAGDDPSHIYSTGNVHVEKIAGIAGDKPSAKKPAPRKPAAKPTAPKKAPAKK